jgi:exonuclease III
MPLVNKDKFKCCNSLLFVQERVGFVPLIFVGDFNTTLHSSKKHGGSIFREASREYMEYLMPFYDLMDINLAYGRFTWSNKRQGPGHTIARLDWFLISRTILEDAIVPLSRILPWVGLDHIPITLELSSPIPLGPIPFHFNPCWEEDPSFWGMVSVSWNSWIEGSSVFIWE